MQTLGSEVLNKILEHEKLNPNQFAESIGLSRTQPIYDIINGKVKKISTNYANKILNKYPHYNYNWLLTGEGDMLKGDTPDIAAVNFGVNYSDSYKLVPLVNMDTVGGMHSGNDVTLTDPEYLLGKIAFNDARDGDICMPVSGNSMTPTCPPGSIVLVREMPEWKDYLGYGNIFVLLLKDGRRIIKEVTRYNDNPKDYVLCVSHNTSVPAEELPKKFIYRVWKVIKILVNEGW